MSNKDKVLANFSYKEKPALRPVFQFGEDETYLP